MSHARLKQLNAQKESHVEPLSTTEGIRWALVLFEWLDQEGYSFVRQVRPYALPKRRLECLVSAAVEEFALMSLLCIPPVRDLPAQSCFSDWLQKGCSGRLCLGQPFLGQTACLKMIDGFSNLMRTCMYSFTGLEVYDVSQI